MKKHILAVATAALACLAGAAQAQSASYAIDPGHTFVTFEVLHFGTSTARGRFDKKEGTVQFDRAGKTGKVDITIDMASINTGVAAFNTHLIGEDFFNTAKFPTAKFTSDKFSFAGDKVSEVSGTLTLMGKSNPVTLKAANFNCYENPRLKREVCGGDFETTLLRSQYGMGYGLPNIPDSVRLTVQIEAVKQ
jgi:polyisoprenoid-binding protein YceI